MCTASAPTSIHSLPTELIEHVLFLAAVGESPTDISAFAQTCRAFHALVYQCPDQHLWREVFLTTFDDPRMCDKRVVEGDGDDEGFDWGKEFRQRIWTMNKLKQMWAPPASRPATVSLSEIAAWAIDALETLIRVVRTALPCPPTICPLFPSEDSSVGFGPGVFSVHHAYPIFPYVQDADSEMRPSSSSRNIAWFEDAVRHGLPELLADILSGQQWRGGAMDERLDAREARLMQALGRVTAYIGFRPLVPPGHRLLQQQEENRRNSGGEYEASEAERKAGERESSQAIADADTISTPSDFITQAAEGDAEEEGAAPILDMSAAAQTKRARRLARMRVYNVRYLSPERHWGPFLPVERPQAAARSHEDQESASQEEVLGHVLNLIGSRRAADGPQSRYTLEEDDGDGDDDDKGDDEDGDENADADSDDEDDEEWTPRRTRARTSSLWVPDNTQLRPDWAFLAAIRVIVETNMREAIGTNQINGLLSPEGLRIGSAPMDMGANSSWFYDGVPREADSAVQKDKGKGKAGDCASGTEAASASVTEGWDWAGVTGVWRRCICWMDYRDLIKHNISSEFNDPSIQEAVRILPLRLRVVSYSPSPVPAYPDRPTIHIEGETSGSAQETRKVRGTVSVIADGSVRWSTTLTGREEGDPDQWVSEGIQIGGPSSGMGVLGLWTGAQHERVDPLGPVWSWKVS